MFSHEISELVHLMIGAAPLLGAYVFGLVFAATHRRHAPRVASLVFAGVGLLTFALVMQRLLYLWLPQLLIDGSWGSPELTRWSFTVTGLLSASISAAGILLLILAAFTGRQREN
jgi:hypothetical protein